MKINVLRDADVRGKRVLLRVDFNVPLDANFKVQDESRIRAALPTIEYLIEQGAKVVLMSHLGRPKGEMKHEFRLNPVAEVLNNLLSVEVKKVDNCFGEDVKAAVYEMNNGEVVMLENMRCCPGEETCDPTFTKTIASYGDIYVTDAFATAHRNHASTAGLAEYLPTYAGFLMEKEIQALSPLLNNQDHPFMMVLGGAKMNTKIGVIKYFLDKADVFCLGGGIANTFLVASGYDVGESLYEPEQVELAQEIMLLAEQKEDQFMLPMDVIVADEPKTGVDVLDLPLEDVELGMKIFDAGRLAIDKCVEQIKKAEVVVWNGPVGLYEVPEFAQGSVRIAEAMAEAKGKTYIGGGDTLDVLNQAGIAHDKFTHVSTGGGAMLKFLEGMELPGIKILRGSC